MAIRSRISLQSPLIPLKGALVMILVIVEFEAWLEFTANIILDFQTQNSSATT